MSITPFFLVCIAAIFISHVVFKRIDREIEKEVEQQNKEHQETLKKCYPFAFKEK